MDLSDSSAKSLKRRPAAGLEAGRQAVRSPPVQRMAPTPCMEESRYHGKTSTGWKRSGGTGRFESRRQLQPGGNHRSRGHAAPSGGRAVSGADEENRGGQSGSATGLARRIRET